MQRHALLFVALSISLGVASGLLGYAIGPQYLILFAGCLLFLSAFLKNFEWGLLLFIFFLPLTEGIFILESAEAEAFNLHWVLIYLVVLCGIFFILAKRVDLSRTPAKTPFFIFLIIWLASFFFSEYKVYALRSFFSISSLFFLYLLFFEIIRTKAQIKNIIFAVSFSSIIPILIGLWQHFNGMGMVKGVGSYIFSVFVNPNDFSIFIMVCIPAYLIAIFLAKKTLVKSIFVLFLVLGLISLHLTHTRTVLIATTVLFITFSVMVFRRKAILPVTAFSFFLLGTKTILRWFMPISGFFESSLSWRINYWRVIFTHFLTRPIFGYGLSSSVHVAAEEGGVSKFPHNVYLKMAFELGIFGLIFYLVIIFLVVRQAIFVYKNASDYYLKIFSSAMVALLVAWVVCGFAIDVVIRRVSLPLFFVMCALIASSKRLLFNSDEAK